MQIFLLKLLIQMVTTLRLPGFPTSTSTWSVNPWQQIKLTLGTLASVLRGQALAPSGYRPIHSVVRSESETEMLLSQAEGKEQPLKDGNASANEEGHQKKMPVLMR